MSRGKAIVLAIFTVWPILYFVFFFFSMFLMIFLGVAMEAANKSSGPPILFAIFFPILILLHLLTMLDMLALLAVYIVYLFKTDRVPQDKKALWAVVLFFANIFAMPVFWYLYVWPARLEKGNMSQS